MGVRLGQGEARRVVPPRLVEAALPGELPGLEQMHGAELLPDRAVQRVVAQRLLQRGAGVVELALVAEQRREVLERLDVVGEQL